MKKHKTNEQLLTILFKDLHTIEAAILRERILMICDMTKKAIAEDPEPFNTPIIHSSIYLSLCDKVEKHLGYS